MTNVNISLFNCVAIKISFVVASCFDFRNKIFVESNSVEQKNLFWCVSHSSFTSIWHHFIKLIILTVEKVKSILLDITSIFTSTMPGTISSWMIVMMKKW